MPSAQAKLWLKEQFRAFYNKDCKFSIKEVNKREFGFGSFSKKIVIRHRAFQDLKNLTEYLKREAPAHINHSIAYYHFPDAEINDKGWIGSDLIFDIDVADLNLECAKKHGDWLCENCFDSLKNEAQKLTEVLRDDFGFGMNEMTVNFSGSRGYHVRISNDSVLDLNEDSRKQIVKYLACNIDPNTVIFQPERGERKDVDSPIFGPKPTDSGLKGRIARTVIKEVERDEKLTNGKSIADEINKGNWGAFPKGYGIKRITEYAKNVAIKIPIDAKVTTDLTHLIRMPETLHGNSSLVARIVQNLDKFEPLRDCMVLGDEETEINVVSKVPKFNALDSEFGPFKEGKMKLPKSVAAYLIAKEKAELGTA